MKQKDIHSSKVKNNTAYQKKNETPFTVHIDSDLTCEAKDTTVRIMHMENIE